MKNKKINQKYYCGVDVALPSSVDDIISTSIVYDNIEEQFVDGFQPRKTVLSRYASLISNIDCNDFYTIWQDANITPVISSEPFGIINPEYQLLVEVMPLKLYGEKYFKKFLGQGYVWMPYVSSWTNVLTNEQ